MQEFKLIVHDDESISIIATDGTPYACDSETTIAREIVDLLAEHGEL